MALVSGPTLANALGDNQNAIKKLVDQQSDDRIVIKELYLRILNRPATEGEIDNALAFWKEIEKDPQALLRNRDARRAEVERLLPERRKERAQELATAQEKLTELSEATRAERERKTKEPASGD